MTQAATATRELILANLEAVRSRIRDACRRAGRSPEEVDLLLVTKTVPAERIRVAVEAGERLIGENKAQEALAKYEELKDLPIEWHFIGHLQTNKVKDVLTFASMIQSVDRMRLVEKLDQQLQRLGRSLDVLIQVNTSEEESKFGVAPEETLAFVRQVARYDTLNIKGLMTIGKLSADPEDARRCFRLLRQLRDRIVAEGIPRVRMEILSMGMSGDLEIAVEEGSTLVRVGTAVFGPRPQPASHFWDEQAKTR
ncbi:YggS family pyridoxal phosphate-dependent enzyme [Thermomicrobiaceae bacterium CFH 74404]|uniref:Pyridoxal phosphate homeostasis protein n=1 Tax=Thermalbibacter longus TaxID=2951981 RepID=A0AA41WHF0_9BACT|nr:YggS family pyridoxal phosphate-dependent enzyme [Thermalbibacter longus]MCM8750505.1 YggS family pyridoxal phosphate-dependent enzyme [Thermalbibacter longus]